MKIARGKVRLKLPIAIALTVLALAKLGVVQNVLAQGKLVVAIQPSVSSDEMGVPAFGQRLVVDLGGGSGHGRPQCMD